MLRASSAALVLTYGVSQVLATGGEAAVRGTVQRAPAGDCLSCHADIVPEPGPAPAHAPIAEADCAACHVEATPGAPLPAPSVRASHRERVPAPPGRTRRLARDPEAARIRSIEVEEMPPVIWVRALDQPGAIWRSIEVDSGRTAAVAAGGRDSGRAGFSVSLRSSSLGPVAVVSVSTASPVAVQLEAAGSPVRSRRGFWSTDHHLRVILGRESGETLRATLTWEDGSRSTHTIPLDEGPAGESESRVATGDLEIQASFSRGAREGAAGLLRVTSSRRVALDIREADAPASQRRDATSLEVDPSPRDHPTMARPAFAGTTACLECHAGFDHGGRAHPLGVMHGGGDYALPAGLPLGPGDQILCSTCHDPHGPRTVAFHTRKDPRRELCIECHARVR